MAARNFNRLAGLPLIGTILKSFLEDLFNATTGHTHDGTAGNGGPLVAYGGVDDATIEENGDSKLQVKGGGIGATQLAANAVETAKIKDANVTAAKLAADAVETAKIKDANVTAAKLASNAVETAKIKDANVTEGKLAAAVAAKLNKGDTAVQKVLNTVTLAEINAGKVILADAAGVTVTPVHVLVKVTGAFAETTSVDIVENSDTPTIIASIPVGSLTDGAILQECSLAATLGPAFLAALTAGKGIKVVNVGNAATGGTSITVLVEYTAVTA